MGDIGAGDPDVAQHALVETCKVQTIPVPAIPNEKCVHRRAQKGIERVHDADNRASGLRTVWCGKRLAGEVVIQRWNSTAYKGVLTAGEVQVVQCNAEFNRRIFHMYG